MDPRRHVLRLGDAGTCRAGDVGLAVRRSAVFTFATAGRIVVGAGASEQVPRVAAGIGRRI